MALNYQHKNSILNTEQNSHLKFGLHLNKRKREDMECAQTLLDLAVRETQNLQPIAKRKQTKPLFRPWLDNDDTKKSETKSTPTIPINVLPYHSSMARQRPAKTRSEKEEQRRKRNNLASLISRRNKQAEHLIIQQQYAAFKQHQAFIMEQNIRTALYLRHLQQLALQRNEQVFVFGQQE